MFMEPELAKKILCVQGDHFKNLLDERSLYGVNIAFIMRLGIYYNAYFDRIIIIVWFVKRLRSAHMSHAD